MAPLATYNLQYHYQVGRNILAATRYVLSTMLAVGPTPTTVPVPQRMGHYRYGTPHTVHIVARGIPYQILRTSFSSFLFTAIFDPLYDCRIHLMMDRPLSTFYGNLRPPLWLPYLTDKRQTVNFSTALQHPHLHCCALPQDPLLLFFFTASQQPLLHYCTTKLIWFCSFE